jgi:SAM-dependent methyltransferase
MVRFPRPAVGHAGLESVSGWKEARKRVQKPEIDDLLRSGVYDYLDLGCSVGGSLYYGAKVFNGTRGLGVDIDPKKVRTTLEAGYEALEFDATELGRFPNAVSFVTIFHFLEHVPGITEARKCILAAISVARDFVAIRQPWFDSDPYLMQHGLKLYWSDWTGHPNAMTTFQFYRILKDHAKPRAWAVFGRTPILDSADPAVQPLSAPTNSQQYDHEQHGPKELVEFDRPIYRETVCIIANGDSVTVDDIATKMGVHGVICASR